MDVSKTQPVRDRAQNRCEYCRLPQDFSVLRFHIEHITARQHGGTDELDNLALACPDCNFHKGTNLTGVDPDTGMVVRLFHPRQDRWDDNFKLDEMRLVGKTPVGRTTIWLLELNTNNRLRARRILLRLGKWD